MILDNVRIIYIKTDIMWLSLLPIPAGPKRAHVCKKAYIQVS